MAESYCGLDVSAKTFNVELEAGAKIRRYQLPNTKTGRARLCEDLTGVPHPVRVCFEPTGSYSNGLALALHAKPFVELSVPNPHALRSFARALVSRSKSDQIDAGVALQFAKRMDVAPWTPPTREVRELRSIARRVEDLVKMATEEKNRLHALEAAGEPRIVLRDVEVQIRHLEDRVQRMRRAARALVRSSPDLKRKLALIDSIPGFAEASSIQVLAEIAHLPADMTARQWVAYAGLDPREFVSGTSVHKPAQISRRGNPHLRSALFLPAMVAIARCPKITAFHAHLLDLKKTWRQAQIAVMRKFLHAIHGMFQNNSQFDPNRFYGG